MKYILICLLPFLVYAELPDIRTVQLDLKVPEVTVGKAAPGKRVKQQLPEYIGTEVYHLTYLPENYSKAKKLPVIVEYAGNGPYKNKYGDLSDGSVDGCNMGYGLSGGQNFIWLTLPYVSKNGKSNQKQWWGDKKATVEYAKNAIKQLKNDFKVDETRIVLCGFSRGAIACNYIGLADDEIANLWSAFICYSHYDGVRKWGYEESDRKSAAERLKRLKDKPQFIIMENGGNKSTKEFLNQVYPQGKFTFVDLKFRNHNSSWLLRNTDERSKVRNWLQTVLKK